MATKPRFTAKDDLPLWQDRIKRALRGREKKEKLWSDLLEEYKGERIGEHMMEPILNVMYMTGSRLLPSIYFKDPIYNVSPEPGEEQDAADMIGDALKTLMPRIKQKVEVKAATLDAIVMGPGWLKHGFYLDDQITLDDGGIKEGLVDNHPFLTRISPFDVVIDPTARTYDEAEWVAQRVTMRLGDAKNIKWLDKLEGLKPTKSLELARLPEHKRKKKGDEGTDKSDDELGAVVLWEVWTKRYKSWTDHTLVFAEGHKKTLFWGSNKLRLEGKFPLHLIGFMGTPDELYPQSVLFPLRGMHYNRNWLLDYLMRNIRINKPMILAKKGAFGSEENKVKFSKAEEMEVVEGIDTEGIEFFFPQNISTDLYNADAMFNEYTRQLSGLPENALGGAQSGGSETAAEARIIQGHMQIRVAELRDSLEEVLRNIGHMHIDLMSKFLVGSFPVVRKDGTCIFCKRDDFKKKIRIMIDVGSTEFEDRAVKKKQWMEAHQILLNNPRIDQDEWMKEFKKAFDITNEKLIVDLAEREAAEAQAANNENILMLQGRQVAPPMSPEIHAVHMKVHSEALNQFAMPGTTEEAINAVQSSGPEEAVKMFEDDVTVMAVAVLMLQQHIQGHAQFMEQRQKQGHAPFNKPTQLGTPEEELIRADAEKVNL